MLLHPRGTSEGARARRVAGARIARCGSYRNRLELTGPALAGAAAGGAARRGTGLHGLSGPAGGPRGRPGSPPPPPPGGGGGVLRAVSRVGRRGGIARLGPSESLAYGRRSQPPCCRVPAALRLRPQPAGPAAPPRLEGRTAATRGVLRARSAAAHSGAQQRPARCAARTRRCRVRVAAVANAAAVSASRLSSLPRPRRLSCAAVYYYSATPLRVACPARPRLGRAGAATPQCPERGPANSIGV